MSIHTKDKKSIAFQENIDSIKIPREDICPYLFFGIDRNANISKDFLEKSLTHGTGFHTMGSMLMQSGGYSPYQQQFSLTTHLHRGLKGFDCIVQRLSSTFHKESNFHNKKKSFNSRCLQIIWGRLTFELVRLFLFEKNEMEWKVKTFKTNESREQRIEENRKRFLIVRDHGIFNVLYRKRTPEEFEMMKPFRNRQKK